MWTVNPVVARQLTLLPWTAERAVLMPAVLELMGLMLEPHLLLEASGPS